MNLRNLILAAASVAVLLGGAPAQCFSGDDGFDLGCCAPAVPTLPAFPPITVLSEYGALTACQQTFVIPPFPVTFSAPTFVVCDVAVINVSIPLASGYSINGFLAAKFTRTWLDFSSPVLGQVYRFLVNGDLTCVGPAGSTPCSTILPRCAPVNSVVHFDGHIDYSCDLFNPNNFVASFSLNHMQGCVSHAPWSCMPLAGAAGHDEVSYHIVGPAPFNFAPSPVPQGPVLADAVRTANFKFVPNFTYQCVSEQRIPNVVGANFLTSGTPPHCSCATIDQCTSMPLACLAPHQCFEDQTLTGFVCCPFPTPAFQSFPIGGTPIAATGLLAQSVGSWGGGTLYPGTASLTIYFGVLTYNDPCGQANWGIHAVVGCGVSGVFSQPFSTTTPCGPPFTFSQTSIDLQNCLPINNPLLPPGYGCLSVPDVVWSLNM